MLTLLKRVNALWWLLPAALPCDFTASVCFASETINTSKCAYIKERNFQA